ncbi:hypothetical protein B0H13DRAFT_2268265 [Mycena leptocephala]|nr:hypothetical protein B0H13DRAFT_2268265 [Mycena leptocephala]
MRRAQWLLNYLYPHLYVPVARPRDGTCVPVVVVVCFLLFPGGGDFGFDFSICFKAQQVGSGAHSRPRHNALHSIAHHPGAPNAAHPTRPAIHVHRPAPASDAWHRMSFSSTVHENIAFVWDSFVPLGNATSWTVSPPPIPASTANGWLRSFLQSQGEQESEERLAGV